MPHDLFSGRVLPLREATMSVMNTSSMSLSLYASLMRLQKQQAATAFILKQVVSLDAMPLIQ